MVQIMVFACVASRVEDSKLGRWWSGKLSTCSDVAYGAIEQGYGSKRGSIPEGRWEGASLVVIVLRTHYGSELGDGGHPMRALGLRGRRPSHAGARSNTMHARTHYGAVCQRCMSFSSPADL